MISGARFCQHNDAMLDSEHQPPMSIKPLKLEDHLLLNVFSGLQCLFDDDNISTEM